MSATRRITTLLTDVITAPTRIVETHPVISHGPAITTRRTTPRRGKIWEALEKIETWLDAWNDIAPAVVPISVFALFLVLFLAKP